MASSNRHWPSMFKSKPSNHHNNQRPTTHDHTRNPHTPSSVQAAEERPPEAKPRWNPKPEQIRTLESIFNSGTVNPSRDEIRRIRVQLQEYGQVGDANVFYWFQNRKSRIKQKQRQLLQNYRPRLSTNQASATAPAASSSSSSNNSNYENTLCVGSPNSHVIDLLNNNNNNNSSNNNSPTEPTILQSPVDFLTEPPSFSLGLKHGNLVNELMLMSDGPSKKDEDVEKMKMKERIIASPSLLGGVGFGESKMSHVFINDVCFEIGMGPVNVRETFGDDAVLLHSSTGQPVLANEWGLTHQPLQHGASYYLLHPHDHAKIV